MISAARAGGGILSFLVTSTPMMMAPMLVYAAIMGSAYNEAWFDVTLASGAVVEVTAENGLVLVGLFCLLIETWKSTSTGTRAVFDLMASIVLLIGGVVAFLTVASFGTALFFTLIVMQFVDVLGGAVVTINGARRDFGINN